jgi:hypothetical protein
MAEDRQMDARRPPGATVIRERVGPGRMVGRSCLRVMMAPAAAGGIGTAMYLSLPWRFAAGVVQTDQAPGTARILVQHAAWTTMPPIASPLVA